jgi:hypothetical protein
MSDELQREVSNVGFDHVKGKTNSNGKRSFDSGIPRWRKRAGALLRSGWLNGWE